MILYHGSYLQIPYPDISRFREKVDFGRGFYITPLREQAEKGIDRKTGRVLVEVSPEFFRPTDVVTLLGDPAKAKRELGWNPTKTPFAELVKRMTEHDLRAAGGIEK